jgi:hypothetical protein
MIKIRAFITGWNIRKHPFIWTKPADEIIDKIHRKRKTCLNDTPLVGGVGFEAGEQPAGPAAAPSGSRRRRARGP